MATGTIQQIIVCVPKSPNSGNSITPCATLGTQRYEPAMMSAYVLDPSTNLANLSEVVPFNYSQAGAAFAFGLTMVLTFWLSAKPIGMMISLVRKS